MKKLNISILITAFILTSCGLSENKNAELEQNTISTKIYVLQDFTKSYEGAINEKYKISMVLSKNKEILKGSYTYKSKGTPIKILGTIDDIGNFIMNEFNEKGSITGVLEGQISENNIVGHWSKPDGSKKMPFTIYETIVSETNFEKNKDVKSEYYSNWSGIYFDKFGRTLKIEGPESDGAVKFELTPKNNLNCQEDVWKGTAYLTESSVANYTEDVTECHFNFNFINGQIEVSENNCSHGAYCGTFDGLYTQKK